MVSFIGLLLSFTVTSFSVMASVVAKASLALHPLHRTLLHHCPSLLLYQELLLHALQTIHRPRRYPFLFIEILGRFKI
jgi:hypothetical protein